MEELTWTERREASFLNVLEASWPQAPIINSSEWAYANSVCSVITVVSFHWV